MNRQAFEAYIKAHQSGDCWNLWQAATAAALAAPATAPEAVAWLARYVGRSGVEQEYVSTHKNLADENDASGKAQPLYLHPPATALAWHDAPTVLGLWACRQFITDRVQAYEVTDEMAFNKNLGLKGRWYGPIPEDRQ